MRPLLWIPLIVGLNCADRAVDPDPDGDGNRLAEVANAFVGNDADADADADVDCRHDDGEISGQVMRAYPWEADESPAPNARVSATPSTGEAPITIPTDGNGQFSVSLPADTYDVVASGDGSCFSESTSIVVDPCDVIIRVFKLTECYDGDTGSKSAPPTGLR